MRRLGLLFVLALGACGSGQAPANHGEVNAAHPAPSVPPTKAAPAANVVQAAPEASDEPPRDDSGIAGLSPAQRRAYELGYRDCSHGRYAPANHLEAYRIGCGAAHDRIEEGRRPQG